MRWPMIVAVSLLLLAGCTQAPPRPSGNYIEALASGNEPEFLSHLYWDGGWFNDVVNGPLDKTGELPIHKAAENGSTHLVEILIEKGADVDCQGYYGRYESPLHAAAKKGHLAVVAILLARHADPNALARGGSTPLDVAEAAGKADVANLLKEFGARRAADLSRDTVKGGKS